MPDIKLLDVDTEMVYTISVSEQDAKKANEDTEFATALLQKYIEVRQNDLSTNDIKAAKIAKLSKLVKSTKSTKRSASSMSTMSPTSSTSPAPLCVDTPIDKEQKTTDSSEKSIFMDGYRWPHEAILALLDIYKEEEHIISTGVSLKKFWNIVSTKLNERDFHVNDIQCKTKMLGLRNTYQNVKEYNGRHTYSCRKWRYFEIMDEMYKKNPWVSNFTVGKDKDDSTRSIRPIRPKFDNENEDMEQSNSPPPSKSESSSKRAKQLEKIISVVEENTNERKRMHQEAMIRQDRLLEILEKMYNSVSDRDEAHSSESNKNPTKRIHKFSTTEKLISTIEESNSKRSKMHEDAMTRQDKLLNILQKMFEKE